MHIQHLFSVAPTNGMYTGVNQPIMQCLHTSGLLIMASRSYSKEHIFVKQEQER